MDNVSIPIPKQVYEEKMFVATWRYATVKFPSRKQIGTKLLNLLWLKVLFIEIVLSNIINHALLELDAFDKAREKYINTITPNCIID